MLFARISSPTVASAEGRIRQSRSAGGYCARATPAAQPGSGRRRSHEPSLGVRSPYDGQPARRWA
eukprot:3321913-Heterocapsa_arctica.AAC.1